MSNALLITHIALYWKSMGENEVEWTEKADIRKAESLAWGNGSRPTQGLKEKTLMALINMKCVVHEADCETMDFARKLDWQVTVLPWTLSGNWTDRLRYYHGLCPETGLTGYSITMDFAQKLDWQVTVLPWTLPGNWTDRLWYYHGLCIKTGLTGYRITMDFAWKLDQQVTVNSFSAVWKWWWPKLSPWKIWMLCSMDR